MKALQLFKKYPLPSLGIAFILGILITFTVHRVFADTSTIHACVTTATGAIRVVGENTNCDTGESLLSWNSSTATSSAPLSYIICESCHFYFGDGVERFKGVDFTNAWIPFATFSTNDISHQKFVGASMYQTGFYATKADGTDFSNANLEGSSARNFSNGGSVSQTATFIGTKFINTNLSHADMGIDMNEANFSGADFTGADLSNGNFSYNNFSNANFTSANLANTSLLGADLTSATFTSTIWSNTICPDGTNSDDDSNTCENNLTAAIPTPTPTPY